jgi:hypothetical protein
VEEAPERALRRVDMPDQLLHVQPERHGVVAVARPGRPGWLLAREHARDGVEVVHLRDPQLLIEQDESRLVAKQLAHGHVGLAVLCKLGPVARDRCVVVEPAARVRQRKRHGSQALGAGHEDDQRVFVPRRVTLGRAAATPQVDDFLAAPIRCDGSADLAALLEVTLELGAYLFEAWSDEPRGAGL